MPNKSRMHITTSADGEDPHTHTHIHTHTHTHTMGYFNIVFPSL